MTELLPYRPGTDLTPVSVMELLNAVHDAIQAVEEPREAAAFVDQADALKYCTEKAHMSQEIQNQASATALRAKRKAGELLRDVIPHNGGRPAGGNVAALSAFGIHEKDSQRWQAIARLPDDVFDSYIAETQASGGEVTTAGVLRVAAGMERVERITGGKDIKASFNLVDAMLNDMTRKAEQEIAENGVSEPLFGISHAVAQFREAWRNTLLPLVMRL